MCDRNTEIKERNGYSVINCVLPLEVTDEDIDDIMVSALEGGICYWCTDAEIVAGGYSGTFASEQISRGGALRLRPFDMDEGEYLLTRGSFMEGFRKYIQAGHTECIVRKADKFGVYTGKLGIDPGKIDAPAADCIIQYAVFGDIIYG